MPSDWKDTSYDLILVIVERFIKMVHSKLEQMVNVSGLAEIISDIVTWYHNLLELAIEAQLSPQSSDLHCTVYYLDVK